MAFNTYSNITAFVNNIYEDALFVARDNNLMNNLITAFGDQSGMNPRKVQVYGSATMNAVGETDDLVSQAFTPTALATLTPAEVGAQFFMTDQRLDTDPFGVRNDASRELGMAVATKMEQDILSDFSSLTGGTIGTAGSVISWGYVFAMQANLRGQNAPLPYVFVCHPYQWHVLAKNVSVAGGAQTNAPNFQDQVMRQWYVQTAAGFDIFVTSNINVDGNGDAYAAMFSRPALAVDIRRPPRLEPQRDSSRRGWELNMTAIYAHGAYRPAFGVQGIFDCATPSS